MPASRNLLVLVCLLFSIQGFSINPATAREWVLKLKSRGLKEAASFFEVYDTINHMDSIQAAQAINELEKITGRNETVRIKLKAMRAAIMIDFTAPADHAHWFKTAAEASAAAHASGDNYLAADICYWYAEILWKSEKYETAAYYALKTVEMQSELGEENFPRAARACKIAADALYHTGNYEKALQNNLHMLQLNTGDLPVTDLISAYNTIALCYQQTGRYNESLQWYEKGLEMAQKHQNAAWISIIKGNTGDLFFLQKKYALAKPLLEFDYRQSLLNGDLVNAANSMQWVARIYLYEKKVDSARQLAHQAFRLLGSAPRAEVVYYRNMYEALSLIYRETGSYDLAWKYMELFHSCADSVRAMQNRNKIDIIEAKLRHEQSVAGIALLLQEKQTEKMRRNLLLAGIIVIMTGALLGWQNTRLRYRLKNQALQEQAAEARQQLSAFTRNIIDKNILIEQLQNQLQAHTAQTTDALLQHTILTDADWEEFQLLFKKVHPAFCGIIKQNAPDITQAELRLAALMRLGLNAKQMASMQGISADSIRKSRFRLKQRLGLQQTHHLEEFILAV